MSAIICVICERHWGSFVQYRLSPLACYSPADYADHAERMQQAASYRRERQVGMVKAVLLFGVCLRKSARSA